MDLCLVKTANSPPTPCPPSELNLTTYLPSFPTHSIYTRSSRVTFAASPNQWIIRQRTGAVVKRLWVEGQRRGISATEMPGFDSRSAKQNLPQESQEGFRTRLPSSDRRMGLVGELFGLFFFFLSRGSLHVRLSRHCRHPRRRRPPWVNTPHKRTCHVNRLLPRHGHSCFNTLSKSGRRYSIDTLRWVGVC